MRERPILFSAPMVRAILEDKKTVTRRIVKPQPESHEEIRLAADAPGRPDADWFLVKHDALNTWAPLRCPYGAPSDRLFVKETWQSACALDSMSPNTIAEKCIDAGYSSPWAPLRYVADGATNGCSLLDFGGKWGKTRVSIHMPRWASRITLEVTGVRVERLHDITEEDARAEGVAFGEMQDAIINGERGRVAFFNARDAFAHLWNAINGKRAPWASNPWLWCISFRRVETP